jgi:nitrite reductase/ring-hydroxylating ferredoxin subunit
VLWDAQREQLVCPCHRGAFDAQTGEPLAGPPRVPLRRLAVIRRGDEVWVESTTESKV